MEKLIEKLKFEKYPTYKDSNTEWMGNIPQHWEVVPGFTLVEERKEKNKGFIEKTVLSLSYGNVIVKPEEKLTGLVPESFETYQLVYPGDIIIRPTDLQNDKTSLRTGLSKNKGIITSAYINLRIKNGFSSAFYHYFLHSVDITKVIYGMGSGLRQNLDFGDFKRFSFLLPPKKEQEAIVTFLDRKTAQIDKSISIKERQIELLKERRQILIHHAVTRGLNPNVKMKDSGVEWIGEMPEHWTTRKLKYSFILVGGGTPSKERKDYWNGDIPWVSPKDIKVDYIFSTEDNITEKGLKNSSTVLVDGDSLLMVVRSGILQRKIPVAVSKRPLSINQDMKAFIQTGEISTLYFFYYVKGNDDYLRNDWVKQGATVESIEVEFMRNTLILIPPIKEQGDIVEHITNIEVKMTSAISFKEKEIEKLKEYKATLINSAVTGKIKVV